MQDEPLTPRERDDLESLPREMSVPAGLEGRVVDALRRSGHVARKPVRWPGLVAAAILMLAVGFGAGRVTSGGAEAPRGDRYLLLLYGGEPVSAVEEAARVAEYSAWAGAERRAGRLIAAEKLSASAQAFGPAGANADRPSGYFLIQALTAEEAAAVAADCPHLDYGGTVVVRAIEDTN